MARSEKVMEINASAERFYEILADFEKYPEFLDEMKGARLVRDRGENAWEVEFDLDLGIKQVKYTLALKGDPPHELSWTLLDGEMMKANNGGWQIVETGPERIRVTYSLELGLKMWVPGAVLRKLEQTSLDNTLKAFKARAERPS